MLVDFKKTRRGKVSTPNQKGQALIELVLAIAIMVAVLSSLAFGFISTREAFARSGQNLQANLLMEREVEAIRSIKSANWSLLENPDTYRVIQSGTAWSVASGAITENGFTRSFEVKNVCRTTATSPPTSCTNPSAKNDPSTKEITVTVSWTFFGTRSISTTFYITRFFGNQSWIQTSQADFAAGDHTNTEAISPSAGELRLKASTGGDWANPQIVASINLPGNQNANDIFVDGTTAYIVTSSGSGPELYIYDVTTPGSPTPLGSLDLGDTGFGVVVADGYAYIANYSNNRELTIVNVTNPQLPTLAGVYDAPSGANGDSIAVLGNTAYLVTDNNTSGSGYELYILNVTNKASPSLIGGLNLNASARDLIVSGSFAFVASTHNTQELQVVNISNPSAPVFTTSRDSAGTSDGQSIYAVNNTLYMTNARLNVFNITTPSNPQLLSQPNFSGSQRAVFATPNFGFLATTETTKQFKVINISNLSNPTIYGSADLGGNGLGLYVLGDYAFVLSANDTAEFQVIRGGVPGNPYQSSGIFESQTFDAGASVAFNFFTATFNEPSLTDLKFQIATNSDDTTWVFVGPDGTSGTYYEASGPIDLSQIEGRYFRFRTFLYGDGSNTPTLLDTKLNYSR